MSLLTQSSLVLIPSGYKEDIVYSVIPNDATGDMSFTRASDGTRINSDGLVEVCPWNLFTYSEQFQNANWLAGGNGKPTMTDNFAEAPNGTFTASKMEAVGANYQMRQNNAIENTQMNFSVYLRTNVGTKTIQIFLNNGNTAFTNATVTTTWQRFEISGTVTTLSGSGRNGLATLEALTSSEYILVYGAQISVSSTAKPYFPTTDRLNVPRLTYQNGGGGCPSLLLEPQRTNVIIYSEDFTNGAWSLDGSGGTQSVTANYSISPDGTQNADRLQLDKTGGVFSRIKQSILGTGVCFWTVYMKSNTSNNQNVGLRLDSTGINCVVTPTWQRFEVSATVAIAGSAQILLFDSIVGNDETADISVWGGQCEFSNYATSYIPTVASSATRIADACSKTGIGSLFGSSYTLSGQFINQGINNTRLLSVKIPSGGSYDNFITIFQSGTGLTATGNDGSVVAQFTIASGSYTVGQTLKFALRCQANNVAFYINGTQIGTDVIATIPAVTAIFVGNYTDIIERSLVNQVVVFNSALTNSQLATLTTI